MKVRKSVNIKYDITDDKLINDYYSTSSHSEIIKRVFEGVLGGPTRSHIAFGPYGAGKSFISTIVAGFLSKLYSNEKSVTKFVSKFQVVDSQVADYFRKIIDHQFRYIPVLINGYDGDFDKVLIKNLKKQVFTVTGFQFDDRRSQAKSVIDSWQKNYQNTYIRFLDFLETNHVTKDAFYERLSDEVFFKLFENFYKLVTSGANLPDVEDKDLIASFEFYSKYLMENNLGIILVYDEFGRMLQNIKPELLNKFMQQLQDLAELSNNQCSNLSLLFVAHKPIGHYFSYLDKEKRSEFAKIEKRFTITPINSDHAAFINISRQVISETRKNEISDSDVTVQNKRLLKYRLFSSDFNATEIENLIIKGCYPLHPVSVFLLPLISKVFGQNERTLFTFITDTSNLGLFGYMSKSTNFYYPDYLVDYFFTNMSVEDEEELKEISIFNRNFSDLSSIFSGNELSLTQRVYKFLMIWSLTNATNYVTLSDHFIAYALGISEDLTERTLENLAQSKMIRFNRNKKNWQLIESSSVNLDDEVQKRKNLISSHKDWISVCLNKYNPYKHLYPKKYNNEYEIDRFSVMRINLQEYPLIPIDRENFDFLIDVNVNVQMNDNTDNPLKITCVIKQEMQDLLRTLTRLVIIDILAADRQFVLENKNVISDLDYERNLCVKELDTFYKKIIHTEYYCLDVQRRISSKAGLEKFLDDLAYKNFKESIKIKNDQINMFQITKQQENPTIQLIRKMVELQSSNLDEHLEGNRPDFLIYYSIKKSNLANLEKSLIIFLETNESAKFSDLVNIVTSPPFGMRPTIAALIIVYLTIERWRNMMFFSNGNFIADVLPEIIYQSGLGIKDFEYIYSNFDFENREFLDFVLEEFHDISEGVKNKSQSIKVLSSIHNWYLSLPVIIQLGQQVGIKEMGFLRIIQKSKTNPIEALGMLVSGYTKADILEIKRNIETEFSKYLEKIDKNLKKELNIESWVEWANAQDLIQRKNNRLVEVSMKSEIILYDYARKIDALELERWPSSMFEMLKNNIKSDFHEASGSMKTVSIEINGIMKKINDVALSRKAEIMKQNLINLINANSRYLANAEIEKVVVDLIDKYVK